jgi:hypothetical protein
MSGENHRLGHWMHGITPDPRAGALACGRELTRDADYRMPIPPEQRIASPNSFKVSTTTLSVTVA